MDRINYFAEHSLTRNGWCIFTNDVDVEIIDYWAGPFSERAVAESEAERLNDLVGTGEGINFVEVFNDLAKNIHRNAVDKGFWDKERNDGELLMLTVSELAEACEALRHGNPPDNHIPEFSGAEVELADAVIRIMDHAEGRGWRLAEAMIAKNTYNKSRPHKHGKEF